MKFDLKNIVIFSIIIFISGIVFQVRAQVGTPFNQRDDQYRLLGLKRAKAAYESARAELERQQKLFTDDLISKKELLQAQNVFADAEVNYQQSLLAVLFEKQYVTIGRAVKYRGNDGLKHVRLTLKNASGSAEFKKLLDIEDALFRSLQPDVINDIYVSLLNNENAIISKPYEAKIEQLFAGHPQTIDFVLLQDLDMVTVNLVYSNGTTRSPKILLEKDATENKVGVQSEQFSQEVEFGGSAAFGLTLELFSGLSTSYKLEVVNLPQAINRYFVDTRSKARLSQFKFTESSNSRKAELKIFLPDRPGKEVAIDHAIPFYICVVPAEQMTKFRAHANSHWTREEIEKLKIGFMPLELVPRGVGKILVRAPQLYQQADTGDSVSMQLIVKNEGSRALNNVEIEAEVPLKWQKKIKPAVIPRLDVSAEKIIHLKFLPPDDISAGKYEIRIRTRSVSNNQPVSGDDKIFTVELRAPANTLGTVLVLLLIIGVITGIVIFGIRLTRR